jgi:phosphoglycerol transferase MdoB-like AlkP superfamily enzyme
MKDMNEKYFAYISISDLSHDIFNNVGYLDRPTHEFMTKLFEENLIEDTVIFFFSDHGSRLDAITGTHSGQFEARLPFMFIYLPTGYMDECRDILSVNQYRLTTPFDIHSTLLHILNGNNFYFFLNEKIISAINNILDLEKKSRMSYKGLVK